MREDAAAHSAEAANLPLVEGLPASLSPEHALRQLAGLPGVMFFDSAVRDPKVGRYSFLVADPFAWIERPAGTTDVLAEVERLWQRYRAPTRPELPPFQGGVAGLFGYELSRSLEAVGAARFDDLPTPALAVGAYDVVLAFDHGERQCCLISQGFPETEAAARRERARRRIEQFKRWLEEGPAPIRLSPEPPTPAASLAPQFGVGVPGVTSNLSPEGYREMVRRGIEYIHAGDVFQVNLAQRLLCSAKSSPLDLYFRLRDRNPAPYAGYFDLGQAQIVSASPECFLTVRGGQVETRPIKGTRGRLAHPAADLFTGDELEASEKDRAENVMIVDLMRNDLSRVCTSDSVHVAQLCRLETYAFVKHLVSVVRGELKPDRTPFDLLRASFPGGSITGAPKVRAMEIIAELEPTARGPYCGSLAYIGFDGQMDASILIRTITVGHGWWQFPVGGGIVAQSDPEDEYRETWHKARGMFKAIL